MAWTNSDGLYVRFGTEEGVTGRAGEYNLLGPQHVTELSIDLTDLTSAAVIMDRNVLIPAGAQIEKVFLQVTEVTAGTNSNLNVGLIRQNMSTAYDDDGLLAAADAFHTVALDAADSSVEYYSGTTEAGALVGTILANSGYITAHYDTGAFTDGQVTIRIYWSKPVPGPDL